ncbi:chromate resistance protein ChrB domain-containing protein [Ideonella sp. A 288]|uniref:chromate resistance protein ChrB domain-containing protein n=1 Tax=Ideonella sp. A 288 TaxID=1962181 RepID=UPI000B4B0CB5|nr:chromate resistance protein ChrB domain-containing protein [Ideonella sp. A 288]
MEAITVTELQSLLNRGDPIEILDVRRDKARRTQAGDIPGSQWRDPERVLTWKDELPAGVTRIVSCAHGHEISQGIAAMLRAMGHEARHLHGGFVAWQQSGASIQPLPGRTRWVTRERPKIDRIACPWLIRRFIDAQAEFLYVPADQVLAVAEAQGATPFDIPGVAHSHDGERCSFDAFIARHGLDDPALQVLATIVRGADTDRLALAPQCAGLLAVSLGLSAAHADDQQCLEKGMVVYDALYAWCRSAQGERHAWTPPPA